MKKWIWIFGALLIGALVVVFVVQRSSDDYEPNYTCGDLNPDVRSMKLHFGGDEAEIQTYNGTSLLLYLGDKMCEIEAEVYYSIPDGFNPEEHKWIKAEFCESIEEVVAVQVEAVIFCNTIIPTEELAEKLRWRNEKEYLPMLLEALNTSQFAHASENGPYDSFLADTGITIDQITIIRVQKT